MTIDLHDRADVSERVFCVPDTIPLWELTPKDACRSTPARLGQRPFSRSGRSRTRGFRARSSLWRSATAFGRFRASPKSCAVVGRRYTSAARLVGPLVVAGLEVAHRFLPSGVSDWICTYGNPLSITPRAVSFQVQITPTKHLIIESSSK